MQRRVFWSVGLILLLTITWVPTTSASPSGQEPAVFTRHGPLDTFDNGGHRTVIILKLLGTIYDPDARALANVLIIGAFIGILEPAPPGNVINQNNIEVRLPTFNILNQRF